MSLLCAYCEKPLECIKTVASEVGETVHEKTEFMCTNTGCHHTIRVIQQSSRPLEKEGYITLRMLPKKGEPKKSLRKLFNEMTGSF